MRQSKLFTKTRREAPADESAKNAQLLIRAGYINKEMAGVYDYLPLGLIVLNKIQNIIREEMIKLGAQEVSMSALQRKELWEKTDRWDDVKIDNWFKTELKDGAELGLGFTHEEPVTQMMEQFIPSYKDLPKYVYQFQTKFRNETRAKSGIMRTREFIMKDLYSFSKNQEEHEEFYHKVEEAYKRIFESVGLVAHEAAASGGSFSKFSHEFQVESDAGEDIIWVSPHNHAVFNNEVKDDETASKLLNDPKLEYKQVKAVEVGNIFTLGDKFSKALENKFTDENGEKNNPFMGSYGIGPGRLMGTIVEVLSDEKGIVWPESVAPFKFHLIEIKSENNSVKEKAEDLYKKLTGNVLYDDRDARAGEKFADADLLGMPYQIIISEKNIASGKVELKNRKTGEVKMVSEEELLSL